MDRTELAWAAGFWDGEGSAYLSGSSDRATKQPQARINQASTAGVPEVLLRFQRALGFGDVQGATLKDGREPLYRWEVSSREDVRRTGVALHAWLGRVKREQFAATLCLAPPSRANDSETARDEWIAWCAGLFDGEGSTYLLKHGSHAGHVVIETAITQSSFDGRPQVLERFRNIVSSGKVYGPYDTGPHWAPVYRWKAHRRREIEQMLALLWPQLGAVKREQALAAMKVVSAQPLLPRGNPAWGNRKLTCVRGHDYEAARVRPFRSRGKNVVPPRASHQCLTCVREAARAKRQRERKNGG